MRTKVFVFIRAPDLHGLRKRGQHEKRTPQLLDRVASNPRETLFGPRFLPPPKQSTEGFLFDCCQS